MERTLQGHAPRCVTVALQISGLSKYIANLLNEFTVLPPWVIVIIVCVIVSLLTEVMSNPAVINVVTPIVVAMVMRVSFSC